MQEARVTSRVFADKEHHGDRDRDVIPSTGPPAIPAPLQLNPRITTALPFPPQSPHAGTGGARPAPFRSPGALAPSFPPPFSGSEPHDYTDVISSTARCPPPASRPRHARGLSGWMIYRSTLKYAVSFCPGELEFEFVIFKFHYTP